MPDTRVDRSSGRPAFEDRDRVISVTDREATAAGLASVRRRLASSWESLAGRGRPTTTWAFSVMLTCVIALTAIGLTMVLSASAVESISKDQSPISLFRKQAIWAVVGFGLMFGLSRMPVWLFRRAAWWAYLFAVVLLVVVLTPLGVEVNGNRNWIQVGSFTMQPSEPAKLALAMWAGHLLARKSARLGDFKSTGLPVIGMGLIIILLVLRGKDLGTAIVLFAILAVALWASGMPKRVPGALLAVAGAAGVVLSLVSSNRSDRIQAWMGRNCDVSGLCDQAQAGATALARGGWLGVGLGQSQVKWSWLPEAHNDFVFAIIGEELGLVGTLFILGLFALFSLVAIRVVLRYDDVFVRVTGSCIVMWIAMQAAVNIAMVVGALPVIGLPLPFISYGGSALTFTLAAVGVLLAFARPERTAPTRPGRKRHA
ncbi:putative lipid II flippase FtsW [Falsarthrobacter nasiphocae]|uniref:Probable peptidoglycan glycosyltransferase FtsW n=1 Tax=Falsarthrobacter nasiphocae TaxID=189863 RepID=A0AAE3YFQ1_9MICC|nr:putative lipid II flippase FtsW [Falsarthrobacter nasiphocae]MDR6891319.1 cell division protein FtsW [Falsarthrobacter nasiphocae]